MPFFLGFWLDIIGHSGIDHREAEKRNLGVDRQWLVVVLATVALDEVPNTNSIMWIKFFGLNLLIRRGLVEVIPKILKINFHPCSEKPSDRADSAH